MCIRDSLQLHGIIIPKLFTDSQRAYSYKDNDPESPEGEKLWPLIDLMRAEIMRHPELDLDLCNGKENPADALAKKAAAEVRGEPAGVVFARSGFARPPGWAMDDDLWDAILEVERRMRRVHPPSNTMNMLQA